MSLLPIGITATRAPTGEFLPAVPIYAEVDRLSPAGLAHQEDKSLDELSRILAQKFKQYIDGSKAADRERYK